MRRRGSIFFLLVALVALSLLVVAAGCGGSKTDSGKEEGKGAGGPVAGGGTAGGEEGYSVVGTYESAQGKTIVLKEDKTFTTDAWAAKKGTYVFTDGEAGKWVDLKFDDGSSARMSVMIAMDEVAAIVDNESGTQYSKK